MFELSSGELEDGIDFCKKHVEELLTAAASLLDSHHPRYALGLYTFAVEEYGKAVWLEKIRGSGPMEGKYLVPTEIRWDHPKKFKFAHDALPLECKKMEVDVASLALKVRSNASPILQTYKTARGKVSIPPYATGLFFDVVERVSDANFDARMLCFYVDWIQAERQWTIYLSPDPQSLASAIQKFRQHLRRTT